MVKWWGLLFGVKHIQINIPRFFLMKKMGVKMNDELASKVEEEQQRQRVVGRDTTGKRGRSGTDRSILAYH